KVKTLVKKNNPLSQQMFKKITEVVSRDNDSIEFYKNLRFPMQEYKQVQIGHFVLIFRVYKDRNFISFDDFDHHDNIY
ncbi:MAG: addiction module toxin RelE, partial [Candidatus Micrarchaeota archaeon]|nr:addiction module toxin RelE [Candidatus Micrarchaeota archaeon]